MKSTERKAFLLRRLEQIAYSLQQSGEALALIGLGSVGLEIDRLDEFSDLDFFVIVKKGCKKRFIESLDWLSNISSIAYSFQNTNDGYKLLFHDEIFCEFAVFEEAELSNVTFAPGRVIWKDESLDSSIAIPKKDRTVNYKVNKEWLLGEILTNLYVGLNRFHRGEKLSASRFIEQYAVDRIIDLAESLEEERPDMRDLFSKERRFESRFPVISKELPKFIQGYEKSCESAKEIMLFLEKHFEIDLFFSKLIYRLCKKS